MREGFGIGRSLGRLLPRPPQVLHGLLRIAAATVVMRQLAVVLVQGGMVEGFHGLRRALMEGFASLVEHRAVGHLLSQGVLEAILGLGEGRLLVEKLFALQGGEEAIEFFLRVWKNLVEETQRELAPNDG